jgi:AraC family transcriptional regulator
MSVGLEQINFWHGGSLWIGRSTGAVEPHAHHAHQISIGLRGYVRLRSPDIEKWTLYAAAFIPAHVRHAYDSTGSVAASIFCEPELEVARRLTSRFGSRAIVPLSAAEVAPVAAKLWDVYASGAPDEELNEAARQVLVQLAKKATGEPAPTDPRIERALEDIERRLDQPLSLEEIAGIVHLSPGRFRHLFVAETGVAFRRYVLWARLQKALKSAVEGRSWTESAHAAHFADSAHLTRTFRRMYGTVPTSLRRRRLAEAGHAGPRYFHETDS